MRLVPVLATGALLVAACSPYSIGGATQPVLTPFGPGRGEVATVCVIRSSMTAQAVTFVVHDNRTVVGATKGHSYFCYEAEPGEHEIVSQTFDSTDTPGQTRAVLVAGGRYWIEQQHSGIAALTSRLAWVDEAAARTLAEGCVHRALTEVPGHEHVPPAVPFARALVAAR